MKLSVLTNLFLRKTKYAMWLLTSSSDENISLFYTNFERGSKEYKNHLFEKWKSSYPYSCDWSGRLLKHYSDEFVTRYDEIERALVSSHVSGFTNKIRTHGTYTGVRSNDDFLFVKEHPSFDQKAIDFWMSDETEDYYFGEYLMFEHVEKQKEIKAPPKRGKNSKKGKARSAGSLALGKANKEKSWIDEEE